MSLLWIKFVHLGAAAFFIGGVFFEVMILSRAAGVLQPEAREQLSRSLGQQARRVMHWVVLALYGAGVVLAWHYRAALVDPLETRFGTLLVLKIGLALSILAHFVAVVVLMRRGGMTARRSRFIHISVLLQMIGIVFLAKAMFLLG